MIDARFVGNWYGVSALSTRNRPLQLCFFPTSEFRLAAHLINAIELGARQVYILSAA